MRAVLDVVRGGRRSGAVCGGVPSWTAFSSEAMRLKATIGSQRGRGRGGREGAVCVCIAAKHSPPLTPALAPA